ncbi:unnamed protein product [Bursaphelenchus okinawaensis]|uniref:Uncharacterized protein n=1 Tax=Bursaphelenchus okinawaensis TaxID=465554 RepID=A0A811LNP8_9BILA|nr:unnamed protein product [Bursaphelenchus okinawaensis]CAG9126261.1 unnamed protein product [Bursaphelenchus okinawaensis]
MHAILVLLYTSTVLFLPLIFALVNCAKEKAGKGKSSTDNNKKGKEDKKKEKKKGDDDSFEQVTVITDAQVNKAEASSTT